MNYKQVVAHYGGLSKAAEALDLERQNVHNWGVRGRIPSRWQLRIEHLTDGQLVADAPARREAAEFASYLTRRP